jgi:hypothetical protein
MEVASRFGEQGRNVLSDLVSIKYWEPEKYYFIHSSENPHVD